MKILMVTHYFDSHRGGIELVAEKIFRGLLRAGCEVAWASADVSDPPAAAGGETVALKTWNGVEAKLGLPFPVPSAGALLELRRLVRGADAVLLHDCLYLPNVAAFVWARLRGVPVMVVQHIGLVPYRSPVLRTLMRCANALVTRPMLARAEQVVFISGITSRYFQSVRFRRPPALVFNGVDAEVFQPAADGAVRRDLRARLGLPADGTVALFVGRFVEKKGLPALRRMAALRPEWTWAFAGWGALDPTAWGAANVKVFTQLRGAAMAELYGACDLLVLPSTGEGFPLVVQEALACGLPVVCGAETLGADADLKTVARGVPVDAADDARTATAFVAAIEALQAEGAGSAAKQAERRAFAVERYSWQRAAARYLELASALIDARTVRR